MLGENDTAIPQTIATNADALITTTRPNLQQHRKQAKLIVTLDRRQHTNFQMLISRFPFLLRTYM